MAINPSTKYPGRIVAPDANYTYGSSQDESAPAAGDGTPYEKGRANDIFGFQQALLKAVGIVPSGNSETQLVSEYLQALVEIVSGRAKNYDESGVANAYVLDLQTNQQGPRSLFVGLEVEFTPSNNNTLASTVNVNGLGVKNLYYGGEALDGGELLTTRKAIIIYNGTEWDLQHYFKGDGCIIFLDSNLAISAVTETQINFDQEEYKDITTMHDNVTNNTRLTVPAGVTRVRLYANIYWTPGVTTGGQQSMLLKNGSVAFAANPGVATPDGILFSDVDYAGVHILVSPPLIVTSGDYFELQVYTTNSDIILGDINGQKTSFAMELLR